MTGHCCDNPLTEEQRTQLVVENRRFGAKEAIEYFNSHLARTMHHCTIEEALDIYVHEPELKDRVRKAEARIAEAIELLEAKQGEWLPVTTDYTPEWVDDIREVIAILRPEQPKEEIQVTPERLDPSMDGLDYE